jgi:putative toxin-antitoxin system antitoxin component (TIGR02293 family)
MASQLIVSRIVPVVAHAVVVFGDEHKASHWLSTPLPLFEDRAPSELLETDEGLQLVETKACNSSSGR